MNKTVLFLLLFVAANGYAQNSISNNNAADSLLKHKQEIAQKMTSCLLSPEDSGQAYVNVCYGNAADSFVQLGKKYADLNISRKVADRKAVEKDKKFFENKIASCNAFTGKTVPYAQKLNWISDCKLYWSRRYAEYFYMPSEDEIKSDNTSWADFVKKSVREKIGF